MITIISRADADCAATTWSGRPPRTAVVVTSVEERAQRGSLSGPDFDDLRRRQTAFSALTAAALIQPAVAANANAEITNVEAVDGTYFGTLGIGVAIGRALTPADDAAHARVAVISDEFWRKRLAADPNVTGREIRLNGQTFDVIGVAEARYRGIFRCAARDAPVDSVVDRSGTAGAEVNRAADTRA